MSAETIVTNGGIMGKDGKYRGGTEMYKEEKLFFKPNFQLFAEGDGGDGGKGDGGKGDGGWTPPTQAEWEKSQQDLHFFKSEHGNLKKNVTDLQTQIDEFNTKGQTDLEKAQARINKLEGSNSEIKLSGLKNIAKYEGKLAGLSDIDIEEIVITADDSQETIAQKVKEKKESLEQRFTEWAKAKGFKSTVLGNGGKEEDNSKTHVEKWNEKAGTSKTKDYYDLNK